MSYTLKIQSLLNKSMTTRDELEKLLELLHIKGNVAWSIDFDASQPTQILNIGNGLIGGTHWVAVDNIHKRTFDPFGLPPVPFIPKDYNWVPLDVQNIRYGHCGQFCALWLYYSLRNDIDKFYELLNDAVDYKGAGN